MLSAASKEQMNIFMAVIKERAHQNTKHPEFTTHNGDRLAILVEEVGEVAKGIQEKDHENLRDELIQVTAVCFRWLEQLDNA